MQQGHLCRGTNVVRVVAEGFFEGVTCKLVSEREARVRGKYVCGEEGPEWDREVNVEPRRNASREGSETKSSWEPSGDEKTVSVFGNCAKAEVWHGVEVGRG